DDPSHPIHERLDPTAVIGGAPRIDRLVHDDPNHTPLGDPRLLLAQHVPRAVDADGQDRQLQTARESEAALTKVQEAPVGAAGPLRSDPDAEAELPKLQTALLHHAVRLGA